MPLSHIVLATFIAMIWGFNFVAIRIGLDHFPPLLFTALRFAVASLPFLPFVPTPGIGWRRVVGIGTFLGVFQFGLLFTGMSLGMPPGLSSVVMQLQAFFTLLLAAIFLGERPGWRNLAGLVLAFAGVVIIAGALGHAALIPFLMVIVASASWAVSNILTRRSGATDAFRLIVWVSAVPPLPLLALSWTIEGGARIRESLTEVNGAGLAALAFVAFAATNFAFGAWSWLLRRHPAAIVAPFSLLVPLFGLSSAMLAFGESASAMRLSGAALIVAGLAANSWRSRERKSAPAELR